MQRIYTKYKKNTRNYELVGRLIEELKLRKYSYRAGKKYRKIVLRFLKSGKIPAEACGIYLNIENGWENLIRWATYYQTRLTRFLSNEVKIENR